MKYLTCILLASCLCLLGSRCQEKLRVCPDEWIVNAMPDAVEEGMTPKGPQEYYIYQGKRVEIAAFDTTWVRKNCTGLKPNVVH
jgi:hypothetical protein